MDKPFNAYTGDEPYVFVSYAHADADTVFPEIQWLHEQGFNVWYDEGIEPGSVWRDELARAIDGAALFLFFVTPSSIGRPHCQREVAYAVDHGFPFLAVHLEKTDLDPGTELTLSVIQAILKYETNEREYRRKLLSFAGQHLERGVAVQSPGARPINRVLLIIAGAVVAGLAGALVLRDSSDVVALTSPSLPTRVTVPMPDSVILSRLPHSFAISDDGSTVVFRSEERNLPLYIWRRDQLRAERLDTGDDLPHQPFLSPDGAWVGYRDARFGEYKRLRRKAGSRPVRVGPSGIAPRRIFYESPVWTARDRIIFSNPSHRGLQTIDVDGGRSATPLTDADDSHNYPELVGDDNLVYSTRDDGAWYVVSHDLRNNETRRQTQGEWPQIAGEFLLFIRDRQLWAARFDRGLLTMTTDAVPVLTVGAVGFADVSASGDLLYLEGDDATVQLVWVDQDGREELLPLPADRYLHPRVSPDGRHIAMVVEDDDSFSIWTYDIQSGSRRLLVRSPDRLAGPVWSPDGSQIAYEDYDSVKLISVLGSSVVTPLATPAMRDYRPVQWHDDGLILVEASAGRRPLIVDADSEEFAEIDHPYSGDAGGQRLSPDGNWLSYMVSTSGESEIHVSSSPTFDDSVQVSESGGWRPLWNHDSREIYYFKRTGFGQGSMYAAEVTGDNENPIGSPRRLFSGDYLIQRFGRNYDLASDGRFLMVRTPTSEPTLVYVQNWLAEIEELVPRAE